MKSKVIELKNNRAHQYVITFVSSALLALVGAVLVMISS